MQVWNISKENNFFLFCFQSKTKGIYFICGFSSFILVQFSSRCLLTVSFTKLSNCSAFHTEFGDGTNTTLFWGLDIFVIKCCLRALTCSSRILTFMVSSLFLSSSSFNSSRAFCILDFLFNLHLWEAMLLRSLIRLYRRSAVDIEELSFE